MQGFDRWSDRSVAKRGWRVLKSTRYRWDAVLFASRAKILFIPTTFATTQICRVPFSKLMLEKAADSFVWRRIRKPVNKWTSSCVKGGYFPGSTSYSASWTYAEGYVSVLWKKWGLVVEGSSPMKFATCATQTKAPVNLTHGQKATPPPGGKKKNFFFFQGNI